jgi:hypothetical protein
LCVGVSEVILPFYCSVPSESLSWPDYGGFPKSSYSVKYPAPGAPELARDAVGLLRAGGVEVHADSKRGFDHGVFVPLTLMFPEATIPVFQVRPPACKCVCMSSVSSVCSVWGVGGCQCVCVFACVCTWVRALHMHWHCVGRVTQDLYFLSSSQVSLKSTLKPGEHVAMGALLAPLRARGVLIVGSGALTHNFGEFRDGARPGVMDGWVREFEVRCAPRVSSHVCPLPSGPLLWVAGWGLCWGAWAARGMLSSPGPCGTCGPFIPVCSRCGPFIPVCSRSVHTCPMYFH